MVTFCYHASSLYNFKIAAVKCHEAQEVNAAFSQPPAPNLLIVAVVEFLISVGLLGKVLRGKSVLLTYPKARLALVQALGSSREKLTIRSRTVISIIY